MRVNALPASVQSLLILYVLLVGCRPRPGGETPLPTSRKPGIREFERQLDQVNPGLRDPVGVVEWIKLAGASFREDLVNNHGNDSIYQLDTALSALNLGIYTVDIAYFAAYGKKDAAERQLSRARTLAENIGAGHLYDQGMFRRYMMAGVPEDSLLAILKLAAEQIEHEFSGTEWRRIHTLFTTGEFIEKIHLTTGLLIHAEGENDDSKMNLMFLLFHQQKSLDHLLRLLAQIQRGEEGERFMAMLGDLLLIFSDLNRPGELADITTSNITENQTFKDLVAQLARIRNQIIDPVYPYIPTHGDQHTED